MEYIVIAVATDSNSNKKKTVSLILDNSIIHFEYRNSSNAARPEYFTNSNKNKS